MAEPVLGRAPSLSGARLFAGHAPPWETLSGASTNGRRALSQKNSLIPAALVEPASAPGTQTTGFFHCLLVRAPWSPTDVPDADRMARN